jgi:hypothetical protein
VRASSSSSAGPSGDLLDAGPYAIEHTAERRLEGEGRRWYAESDRQQNSSRSNQRLVSTLLLIRKRRRLACCASTLYKRTGFGDRMIASCL